MYVTLLSFSLPPSLPPSLQYECGQHTIGREPLQSLTEDAGIGRVKQTVAADSAPGIVDADLESSLSRAFGRVVGKV